MRLGTSNYWGIATMFSLESTGIGTRATKDIDLVILINPNTQFADKLRTYVRDGALLLRVDRVVWRT